MSRATLDFVRIYKNEMHNNKKIYRTDKCTVLHIQNFLIFSLYKGMLLPYMTLMV